MESHRELYPYHCSFGNLWIVWNLQWSIHTCCSHIGQSDIKYKKKLNNFFETWDFMKNIMCKCLNSYSFMRHLSPSYLQTVPRYLYNFTKDHSCMPLIKLCMFSSCHITHRPQLNPYKLKSNQAKANSKDKISSENQSNRYWKILLRPSKYISNYIPPWRFKWPSKWPAQISSLVIGHPRSSSIMFHSKPYSCPMV